MHTVSLYWFAAQQKFGLYGVKFSAEFNEFSLFLQKQQDVAKKKVKTKVVRKNANMCHSEAKV